MTSVESSRGTVQIKRPSDRVGEIVIDNPPHNIFGASERAALLQALRDLEVDDSIHVVVLRAEGGTFSAGNDIRELSGLDPSGVRQLTKDWDEISARIRHFPVPVVVAVCGYALGGAFELVLSSDLRVASRDALIGCTASRLAIVMSTHSISRAIPAAIAREMVYTARRMDAAEAQRWGLFNLVVEPEEFHEAVAHYAQRIADQPVEVLRASKLLMTQAGDLPRANHDLWQSMAFSRLAERPEHSQAVLAFLEGAPAETPESGEQEQDR